MRDLKNPFPLNDGIDQNNLFDMSKNGRQAKDLVNLKLHQFMTHF